MPHTDRFGFVAPFMLALCLLLLGSISVWFLWTENYGDATVDIAGTFSNAWNAIKSGECRVKYSR
jgi:hypothetical protein